MEFINVITNDYLDKIQRQKDFLIKAEELIKEGKALGIELECNVLSLDMQL